MSPRGFFRVFSSALVLALPVSCGANGEAPQNSPPELSSSKVAALPDTAHPTLIDFGGKVHLVGYELSPEAGGPGDTLRLKLYWKVVSRVAPGWNLFTHLEDDAGRQIWNFDRQGTFRSALGGDGLSALEMGKIYADEQSLELPKAEQLTPRVAIVVGVWLGDMRLPVVSGVSNGHEAGVVARFSTGMKRVVPQKDANRPP